MANQRMFQKQKRKMENKKQKRKRKFNCWSFGKMRKSSGGQDGLKKKRKNKNNTEIKEMTNKDGRDFNFKMIGWRLLIK